MRIVFWQNSTNLFQAALIRGLSEIEGMEIDWVVENEGRRSYWNVPEIGTTRLFVRPSEQTYKELLKKDEENSLHIFSMHHHPNGLPMLFSAYRKCLAGNSKMGLLGEGTAWGGRFMLFRKTLDIYDRIRWSNRVRFILAQGDRGIDWFRQCGYPDRMIFPFGFFVDKPQPIDKSQQVFESDEFTMLFIGACIARKGLDVLLNALNGLKHLKWKLNVIGDGEQRSNLEALSQELKLDSRVTFLGSLPNSQALQILSGSDLLVLPSRSDSWGVVVNEALLSGVPVICSSRCGSRILLQNPELGDVVDIDSLEEFRGALSRRIGFGKKTEEMAARIENWSGCIERKSITSYVLRVISAAHDGTPRPVPPWMDAAFPTPPTA